MKKNFFILLLSTLIALGVNAQGFEWAKSMGGTNSDIGNFCALDVSGNVYTTGYFSGTTDFDPGPGIFNLTSLGGSDIFISKLDSSGNFVWAKQFGGTGNDAGNSIAIDIYGNICTTGYFWGTVDFDPGIGVYNLTSAGSADVFVSKLDTSGNFIWAKQMGGTNYELGSSIYTDTYGNVYTTGYFYGISDFDPGAGVYNLTSAGSADVFISKLDTAGNFIWAKRLGGAYHDYPYSITADVSGNVYTTGIFLNTADFDPGAGVYNLSSAGQYDIFVSKLNAFGNFEWAKRIGGIGLDYGLSISYDASGNIYTVGSFYDTVDFDPGVGVFNMISASGPNTFISKLDTAGNFVWAKSMEGLWGNIGLSITIDTSGNVYSTGYFNGIVDFDPGTGTFNLTSVGGSDIFVSKLDVSGNFIWAKQLGGTNDDYGYSISTDASGNVYTTGAFSGTADFDPGIGTFNLTSAGWDDIFVHKLSYCQISTSSIFQTECDSFVSPSGNYNWTSSGIFIDIIQNYLGCDSVITINLTINIVDTSVTVNNNKLNANANGATYQWVDCNNNYAVIPGETNQTFTPSVNGSYAVIVTQNNCTDTSACYTISNVGIKELANGNIKIYPNPTNGFLHIECKEAYTCVVYNSLGEAVYSKNLQTGNNSVQLPELATGMYIMKLHNGKETYVEQIVIQQK
jgi:uncharacterized membrane protein YqhA